MESAEFDGEKFRQGVILFNSGEFFKAHELWEDLWRAAARPDKQLLQGLIQIAAAFHHLARGNRSGTQSLLPAGMKKLAESPAEYRGVNMDSFRSAVREWSAAFGATEKARLPSVPRIGFCPAESTSKSKAIRQR